jgi:chromosome segregation ATPase
MFGVVTSIASKAMSFIPGPVKILIVVGLILTIVGLGVTISILHSENQNLNIELGIKQSDMVRLEGEVRGLNQQIKLYDQVRELEQQKYNTLTQDYQRVQESRDDQIAQLNEYRERLDRIALQNPEAISRLATAATNRVLDSIRAASRGETHATD